MSIVVRNITKRFGAFCAVDNVSFEAPAGKLVALLGPSGSGKTTLLRIIAGLESSDAGQVIFHGENATERSARQRNVGFVFQHYALFRHMNIFENVAFPLRIRKRPRSEIQTRVNELLELVQLRGFEKRFPSQLSGGQRQRIALARALAARPRVLLLDEPFGALDAQVRKELRRWLRQLHDEMHVTSLFVTHDQEEALEVADEVVIFNHGKIEQSGTPDQVYNHPANPFVLNFLGHVNIFHGRMRNGQAHLADGSTVAPTHAAMQDLPDGAIAAYVRPHEIQLIPVPDGAAPSPLGGTLGTIVWIHHAGAMVRVELKVNGTDNLLIAELPRERFAKLNLTRGQSVCAVAKGAHVFPTDYEI